MLHRHAFHRGARWFTLLALLLATLAPGVAHALRHARGEVLPWSQLCSATGAKRMVLEQPGDGGAPFGPGHAFTHCVYCALHVDASPVASAVQLCPLRADLAEARPKAHVRASHPAPAWPAAQARAPPLHA